MKIEVVAINEEAIQAALDAVNHKAASFGISNAKMVMAFARVAEDALDLHCIVDSDRVGAKLVHCPAGPTANRGTNVFSTEVTLSRTGSGWYLTDVKRVDVHPNNAKRFAITISDHAANNLVKRGLAAFGGVPTLAAY